MLGNGIVGTLALVAATAPAAEPNKDGWISLFNGKDLTGWKANEKPEQWKVEDGAIVAHGDRSHLFYVGNDPSNPPEFKNFHFKAELMTEPKANSGIYFHTKWQKDGWPSTGYEAQVNNSHGDPGEDGQLVQRGEKLRARRRKTTNGSPKRSSSRASTS